MLRQTLPKSLTFRIGTTPRERTGSPAHRTFAGSKKDLYPAFAHPWPVSTLKRLPQMLTFRFRRGILGSMKPRHPAAPGFPHHYLSRCRLSMRALHKTHAADKESLPKKLTLTLSRPKIPPKTPTAPAKPHLYSAFSPVFAHLTFFPAENMGNNTALRWSRKRSLSGCPRLEPFFKHSRALARIQVPQNLTFARASRGRALLNPLTICPGAAHRAPRSSSL